MLCTQDVQTKFLKELLLSYPNDVNLVQCNKVAYFFLIHNKVAYCITIGLQIIIKNYLGADLQGQFRVTSHFCTFGPCLPNFYNNHNARLLNWNPVGQHNPFQYWQWHTTTMMSLHSLGEEVYTGPQRGQLSFLSKLVTRNLYESNTLGF